MEGFKWKTVILPNINSNSFGAVIELTCSVEENGSATHRLVQVSVVVVPFLVLLLHLVEVSSF